VGHSETRATWKRPVAGAVATAGVVAGAGYVRRRRALIKAVAPELRHPVLYLPTNLTSVTRLRLARRFLVRPTRVRPGVIVTETTVPGVDGGPDVAVITYHRAGASEPTGAMVWIHGGGTVLGRAEIGHEWCSTVADELGLFVVSVDYRLAPEHPFPAALDDCVAALRWLLLGSFAEFLWVLLFAQVLHAATFGSFHAAAIHFVQRSFGPCQQGQGQALYAALAGTGGALGALYAGYSWNALGATFTFSIASLAALAAAVIIASRMQEELPK